MHRTQVVTRAEITAARNKVYDSENKGEHMQLQVKDLKRLSKLSNCRLVAGKNGLSKDVRWFFVCFFDDIDHWIYEKEVVFLPGVGINTNTEKLADLMEKFHKKNVSAIYVIIGYQFYEMPEILIKLADQYDIPLFEMPNIVPLVEITKELSEMILLNQTKKIKAENILKDALFGHSSDIQWHAQNLRLLGYELCKSNYIIKIRFRDFTFEDENRNSFIDAALNTNFSNLIYFQHEHSFIIGIIMTDLEDASGYLRERCSRLVDMIKEGNSYQILSIGISEPFRTLCEAKKCLHQASQALECIFCSNTDDIVFFYDEMSSILKIIQELNDKILLESCYRHILEPLITYDEEHGTEYIKTLSVYMNESGNNQRIATLLNIHRNTLLYRMAKIKEILGCNLDDSNIRFEIQTELYIYNYMNANRM